MKKAIQFWYYFEGYRWFYMNKYLQENGEGYINNSNDEVNISVEESF